MKTYQKITFYLLTLCFLCSNSFAQNKGTISGSVFDNEGEPAMYANIILKLASDSSLHKGAVSNEEGNFEFVEISFGEYFIEYSYVGFEKLNSEIFEFQSSEKNFDPVTLSLLSNDLAEVTVTAQRPLIEMKPDMMVFNVEGTINSNGDNALELMKKSPGVMVDNNDAINLLGKSGVNVMINGKPSPLSGDELATYLKTIQADQIDAIEIITNPSSKYEAEGNAGIINIKLKKDARLGANASLNMNYSIGKLPRYNTSLSSNYRNAKINVFGNVGYYNGENYNNLNFHRELNGLTFDNENRLLSSWEGKYAEVGFDYSINEKHTVGFLFDTGVHEEQDSGSGRTNISMVGNTELDSILVSNTDQKEESDNLNANLNYRFNGKNGSSWNVDLDYGVFNSSEDEFQPNTYFNKNESQILSQKTFATNTDTDIKFGSFKIDFESPMKFKDSEGKIAAGVKFGTVETDNLFDFYNVDQQVNYIKDMNKSNQFVYNENVNAAYVNYSGKFGEIMYNVGIRAEQTNSKGELIADQNIDDKISKRSYIDFFPSVGLTYQAGEKHNFNLSYGRRINRPSYQDLNPFEFRLDELTFEKGNPFLSPEYTHNIQLKHTFNFMLNTTLSYSKTNNVISRMVDASDDKAVSIGYYNIADQDQFSLNIAAPLPIADWWRSYTGINTLYENNKSDFGNGRVVDLSVVTMQVFTQHTFQLPYEVSLEVSGWYSTPTIFGGNMKTEAMWSMDAGLQKKVLKERGKISLGVSDVFATNKWAGESTFGDLYMKANGANDNRRFKMKFSYLFGNSKVKSTNRNTGLEDEQKRIKSGN